LFSWFINWYIKIVNLCVEKTFKMTGWNKLPLVEEFYTIQGEGYHTGKPAYFIRIGGCDIGCSWCDTKFSWNPDLFPLVETDRVIENVLNTGAKAVVVTGGEPLMYNLTYLCSELKKHRVETFIETCGAYPLTGVWDWICLSPKRSAPPLKEIMELANELKVIIQTKRDIPWAKINADRVKDSCHLFLQPEWSRYTKILPVIVDHVKKNPRWRISLQVHKFMHIP
jgi:7-carboxy-7-deazaguanine synthase